MWKQSIPFYLTFHFFLQISFSGIKNSPFFELCFLAKILYYSRFTNNDFLATSYDSNYCGNTESWPTSAFSASTNTWNTADITAKTNWANWGGWVADTALSIPTFNSSLIQTCAKQSAYQPKILGGWNLFGLSYKKVNKTFVNVLSHYQVEVDVNLYFIDSWDTEWLYVNVDSTLVIQEINVFKNYTIDYCGFGWADHIDAYNNGTATHSASSLTISFYDNLDQPRTDESYGFKDFYVFLITTCDGSCLTCSGTTANSCTSCPALAKLISGQCICRDKFYMATNPYTHCEKCHISCKTCTGNASTQCSSCYTDFTLSSSNTCVNTCNFMTF